MNGTLDALTQAGLEASQRNDMRGALAIWAGAAAAAPASPLPHFLAGAEFAQAGQMAKAETAYASAVDLDPSFEMARYQLGLLQLTSGRAALAQITWEPLVALPVGHHLRHFVLGFAALAHDEFSTALASFDAGIRANGDNAPMNGDIAKVIQAIEALPVRHRSRDAVPAPDDAHVLLNTYARMAP